MWPSTRATRLEAATSVDWVTFRELATTLKPRSTNPFTIPAPIPCEAPVTMAVFRGLLMVVSSLSRGSAASQWLAKGANGAVYDIVRNDLATSRFARIRRAAFGPLKKISRPSPPALGHLGNRQ